MKIGVEASAIFRSQKTGVGYYSHNILQALIEEMPNDDFYLSYISFVTKKPERLEFSPSNVHYRRISLIPGKLYNFLDHYLIALPIDILARIRADVYFFPNFFRWPLWLTRSSVVVIHDLGYLETPEYIVPRHRKYLARRVPQSAHKASHIIAISESTKRQLVGHYGIAQSKISVVTPAVDATKYIPASETSVEAIKKKYSITKKYLLYLGTIEPRKNIRGIIEGYMKLPKEIQSEYQLVLAGGKGWLDEEIYELSSKLPLDTLVRTGYVENGDEPALYTGATLFIYTSHYEGWGMQILEAMSCGTPVITARNSSLEEAGGLAAAYVETNDPQELADLTLSLLQDKKRLKEMTRLGFSHVKKFTWEKSASILVSVLRDLKKNSR